MQVFGLPGHTIVDFIQCRKLRRKWRALKALIAATGEKSTVKQVVCSFPAVLAFSEVRLEEQRKLAVAAKGRYCAITLLTSSAGRLKRRVTRLYHQ